MKTNKNKIILTVLFAIALVFVSCGNHLVQRSAANYFPYKEGNWWRYLTSDSDTIFSEVEAFDTLLMQECYPVDFSGTIEYYKFTPYALEKYYKYTYNFAGYDYTIVEDFIDKVELPLVKGNSWQDSLIDSIEVSGQLFKVSYYIQGQVLDFAFNKDYGDCYELKLNYVEKFESPDTVINSEYSVNETYAPDIGLVEFKSDSLEYILIDYQLY